MELALTTYYRRVHPNIRHVHRELNTWADQLTHNDTANFEPRMQFTVSTTDFYILTKLQKSRAKS